MFHYVLKFRIYKMVGLEDSDTVHYAVIYENAPPGK
jgi:hypothetical protein